MLSMGIALDKNFFKLFLKSNCFLLGGLMVGTILHLYWPNAEGFLGSLSCGMSKFLTFRRSITLHSQ